MKRFVSLALLLSVPFMMFLVVDRSARQFALAAEARRLESAQAAWVGENRKLLSNIAIAKGRVRVGEAVRDAPGYVNIRPERTLRIRITAGQGKTDG